MKQIPVDMRTGAIALHELFTSYMDAGFKRGEAFALTQTALAVSMQAQFITTENED